MRDATLKTSSLLVSVDLVVVILAAAFLQQAVILSIYSLLTQIHDTVVQGRVVQPLHPVGQFQTGSL